MYLYNIDALEQRYQHEEVQNETGKPNKCGAEIEPTYIG